MGDATRFAVGIAILLGAFIFLFFAFHPGGVEGVTNPVEALQWLINEFNNPGQSSSTAPVEPTPTGAPTQAQQLTGTA
jgi:hypothetical protein